MKELQITTNAADIDVGNIPTKAIDDIARGVLGALEVAVQNREFMKGYEVWKKKRGVKNAACTV